MKRLLLSLFVLLPFTLHAAPLWIWSAKKSGDKDRATFRTTFKVTGDVESANLRVVCDNGAVAFINGQKVLTNPDWQETSKADVKAQLQAGENEIRLEAQNKGGSAALLVKLDIKTKDGAQTSVETGEGWQFTLPGKEEWKPATVIASHGDGPWGNVLADDRGKGGNKKRAQDDAPGNVIAADQVGVPKGFKVELLYNVPKAEQGSWVSMTVDPKGNILAGDQYGVIYRVTVPPVGSPDKAKVEPLGVHIGGAHGLLYAHDSLYVMINETSAEVNKEKGLAAGIWRLKDKGDGTFGEPELLRKIAGGGEHGPHSLTLSPDGKRIFFACGNHTKLPENMELSRAAMGLWDEDHVLPRMWDARGHARGILAPGGYICSMDPEGKSIELFCLGFRNEFDLAFDLNGELFTYDSDMEWDIGTPWYRPTAIHHCVSGVDYGWRSASSWFPEYYIDCLPALQNIGPGSPTGVVSGLGAKFPAKYQRAIFAADWTYGTMWAIHLTPQGGTYKPEREEFMWGKPLPLTDVLIHPNDGAMYVAVGGRRTQSGLYRITYVGEESTAPAKPLPLTPEMTLRRDLEKLHDAGTGPDAIEKAWPHLANKDRNVRYAARVAIERQPAEKWQEKVFAEKDQQARIEAIVALARVNRAQATVAPESKPPPGSSDLPVANTAPDHVKLQVRLLDALASIELGTLDLEHQLRVLRAYQLVFTRLGKPAPEVCAKVAARLDVYYPHKDNAVNRELCQTLVFVDSKSVAAKTLGLMAVAKDDWEAIASDSVLARNDGYAKAANEASSSRPNKQQIAYMFALRNCKAGWTPELRSTYFGWFPRSRAWKGGNSFAGFLENTRQEALANFAPADERAKLDELSSKMEAVTIANYVPPKGPGKTYTIDDVLALAKDGLKQRNYENGKAMFNSTLCATCHRFNGDGGSIGPDITGSGNRYTLRDFMENIIEPSKVVSDQYDSHLIEKKDGSLVIGRVVSEDADTLQVMMNPFAPTQLTAVKTGDVKSKKTQPVSMMPPGLINVLNKDELLDLIAYTLSGGNPQDKMFAK
ncbi:heme-binding protein [Verrucomicrobiaceae bacterium SCGC AG-212-N21]|nr:heme-binding protein [Verrucomicrobiaceae bacterium SCGC AG-212-N21]